ncbi:PREDICTED: uncharacterized protein LOC107192406, partial [Dufourea novaeangliae]|uniref:uncharacterized protein LOC107192406 n=1 Tax=Dufourea novaeangliae TaxID=178035 RepID=UPI000766E7FB
MKECFEVIQHENRPNEIKEADWDKKEIRAKNYIVNSVTDTQLEMIIKETTARKMIRKLDEIYLVKSSAIKLLCKRKLLDLKMKESENSTEFLNEFEKLINELGNAGEIVSKDDKVNYLLLALPVSLSHIVDVVDALPDKEKSIEYVKSKLMLEYQKRQSNGKNDFQAFNSNMSKHNKNYNSQYKKFSTKRFNNEQPSNSRFLENRNKTYNQMRNVQRFCKSNTNWQDRPSGHYDSRETAGASEVKNKDKKNSFEVEVMKARVDTQIRANMKMEENIEWLLDSGCSDHM